MRLPAISRPEFLEYLDFQFEATGKPADEEALNYLARTRRRPILGAPSNSPGSVGQALMAATGVTLETVIRAHDRLVQTIERSEFSAVLNILMSGDEAEVNEVRALQMLADRGGENVTSRPLVTRYGFSSALSGASDA